MPLSIRSPEVEYRARELARRTGTTMTEAIAQALAASLDMHSGIDSLRDRLSRIAADCARLPDLDPRTPDEILGYSQDGAWDHGR